MEIHQKISVPNYQELKTMVKRCLDQKLRLRNFDARHGRIESGSVVKSRFPRGHWSLLRPGLEKKPNRKWDRTAASMILQLVQNLVTQFFGQPVLLKEES